MSRLNFDCYVYVCSYSAYAVSEHFYRQRNFARILQDVISKIYVKRFTKKIFAILVAQIFQ